MRGTIYTLLGVGVLVMAGCVTSGTHEQTVAELDLSLIHISEPTRPY